ncbi:MAG TPA: NAD(P)-dependent oxidoreductase [bacterium]|jgi:D-3-phosphoglycerate dehydrogenase|nr:NAD(P)-dependent oxidoreductase [bacterium]HNW16260.1 NAD(P)-dependent oxidoreductase [bacterium]HNZ54001.1 NAD(P)-dependent oxidoreductase [bacterium]HOG44611.1 NAD(P)-dependent oxidoreductase [bacterium]HPV20967.1 NAD(P)-dependent oxidoreductase [bacterium]
MKRVLLATDKPFAAKAVSKIQEICDKAGYQLVKLESYTSPDQLKEAVKDVHAIIVRSDLITREIMDAAPELKIAVRGGAGFDNIDCKAAAEKGIVVMNTPGVNANAVAELAIGMAVYVARGLFTPKTGGELLGKTIGIHAYGNVGKNVARIAKGFGMEVYAFDPFVKKEAIEADGVKVVDTVEDLYKKCQYVSLHIPANDKTKKSINKNLIALMPKGATLINTARKEVVCEEGLKFVFEERPDFKYVTDVAPDNAAELAEKFAGRIFCTPKKMGAQTNEANDNAAEFAANNIVNFFEKGDITYKVN